MRLAVVLVSTQTIPNVVYLKSIDVDNVLLITTKSMENKRKSNAIMDAIGNRITFKKIEVDPNSIYDIKTKLDEYCNSNKTDNVIVNVTGGTKIMSLATYEFFINKDFTDSIVYFPIGKMFYKKIYPLKDDRAEEYEIKEKVDVEEYLKAIGVEVESYGKVLNEELSYHLFNNLESNRDVINEISKRLREYRDSKKVKNFPKSQDYTIVRILLEKLRVDRYMKLTDDDFSKRTFIDYFSGGWFEEYVYLELKSMCFDDIKLNVKIKNKLKDASVPNEFDVLLIKNNNLKIVECKSGDLKSEELTNILYKVAYLNNILGLSANSYLVSLDNNIYDKKTGEIKKSVDDKFKIYGNIGIIDRKNLLNRGLKNCLNNLCK